jgi:hypothetical protein
MIFKSGGWGGTEMRTPLLWPKRLEAVAASSVRKIYWKVF